MKPSATAASGRSRRKADEDEDDLDAPVEGRVKICSKSLVFVPTGRENLKRPLMKFMLSDFQDDIQGLEGKAWSSFVDVNRRGRKKASFKELTWAQRS